MEGTLESNDIGARGRVLVTITDNKGEPVADVQVSGEWGGLVRGRSFGITGEDGTVSFVSKSTVESGIIKFKVKNVGVYGYTYDPSKNIEDEVKISTEDDTNLAPEVIISADRVSAPTQSNFNLCGSKSYDQDGSIVAYEWDLGDGTHVESCTINHSYQEPGDYNAILTVTDDQGKEASAEIIINVTVPGADS
jgi:PKD repeat protein